MNQLVIYILILVSLNSSAQMVVNPSGDVLETIPFFNPEFIKSKKLKSMRGSYSTKFDLDIIRPTSDSHYYEFNRVGQLVKHYKIHFGDTLISTYLYDYKGNVVVHRESNRLGYYENHYSYDIDNRLIQIQLRRDKVNEHNKISFELDESKIVSTETYEYIGLEGVDYKRACYNSSNRIYRIEFYYFNYKGQLAKKESALHNGSSRTESNYFYNDLGQLEELKTIGIGSGTHSNKKIFEYDLSGNVLAKKQYRSDKIIGEDQLVFDDSTGILKAVISRGEAGNMLTILQFNTYRFF